jgi:hypothetical protein
MTRSTFSRVIFDIAVDIDAKFLVSYFDRTQDRTC